MTFFLEKQIDVCFKMANNVVYLFLGWSIFKGLLNVR